MKEGKKDSDHKPKIEVLFKQFPDALKHVVRCSEYGHEKYKIDDEDWLNFKRVPNAEQQYRDAGLRHRMDEHSEGAHDSESGLLHLAHAAWNHLAALQLYLEKTMEEKSKFSLHEVCVTTRNYPDLPKGSEVAIVHIHQDNQTYTVEDKKNTLYDVYGGDLKRKIDYIE